MNRLSQEQATPKQPANPRQFAPGQELSGSARLRGGGRSHMRTRLHPKFPANREINREFRQIRLLGAILKTDTRANSEACSEIPY